jgi:hypothetical protein
MDRPCRRLLLPASEIFSSWNRDAEAWEATASDAATAVSVEDWNLFVSHCEALLKAGGLQASRNSLETVAFQIAAVSNRSCLAGIRASMRMRAGAARAAKRRKADVRGRIVRQAILAVCAEQRIIPTASEKFALSIQAQVVHAATQLGLADAKCGTSTRSIQRHIAHILKDDRMP